MADLAGAGTAGRAAHRRRRGERRGAGEHGDARAPADTYVRDGTYSGQNYGQAVTMEVKNVDSAGYDRQAYVRFDLTGVGSAAEITSAKVRLYGKLLNTMVASMPIGLYPVANTTWSEAGLTWSNKPAAGASPIATKTVSGTTGAWYEFDVTSYLSSRSPPGRSAVAFMLYGTTVSQGYAASTATRRPRIGRNWSSTRPAIWSRRRSSSRRRELTVPEGSSVSVTVKLAAAPASDMTVHVVKEPQTDPDMARGPAAHVHPRQLEHAADGDFWAGEDADTENGTALFELDGTTPAASTPPA